MRQILTGALLFLFAVSTFSQHAIFGKVVDEKGNALVGATVQIQNTTHITQTTNNGSFRFEIPNKSSYIIKVAFIGYETLIQNAILDKENVVKISAKSYAINEITVSSVRATNKSAMAYSNVSSTDIAKRNLGQDIPYLLALTPSFVTTSDAGTGIGYTGFRIRGTDANRINMTVNGVPLNDSESHSVYFVNMPDFASSLSSVQVQRGVGTSTNGAAAFGASINMQTEVLNAKPYAEISSTLGSFNTNKNSLKVGTGLLGNNFAFDARLSNVTSDGYIDRASVNLKSYYLSAGYFAEKTVVKLIHFGGSEKTYQAWNGVSGDSLKSNRTYNELGSYVAPDGKTKFYNNQTDNYNQKHYQLHWLQTIAPSLNLNSTAFVTTGKGYYEEYKTDQVFDKYNLTPAFMNNVALETTDLVRRKWLDNTFSGITSALNYSTSKTSTSLGGAASKYVGHHFGNVIWVRNAQNLDVANEYYRSKSIKYDGNVFFKLNTEVYNNLFLLTDLQCRIIHYIMAGTSDKYNPNTSAMTDITQAHTFSFFNPKLGLTYKINNNNDVYASYSIANREPNRSNYTDAGTKDLPVPERLFDTEIGYRFLSSKLSLGANFYYMKYDNQLILTGKLSEIGELLTSNVSDSYRTGIEFTAAATILEWLNWNGNLTLSQSKIKKFTEEGVDLYDVDWNWIGSQNNELGKTNISYSPNVVANSVFTVKVRNFECGFQSNYVGKQYIDNTSDNARSINAYFVNNINAKYEFKLNKIKSVELNLLINNVFNEEYSSNGYTWYAPIVAGKRVNDLRFFPQAGANMLGSVTLKF